MSDVRSYTRHMIQETHAIQKICETLYILGTPLLAKMREAAGCVSVKQKVPH